MDDFSVVVAGHICLDVIPNLDQLPKGQFGVLFQPGHLISAGPALFCTGGTVSNTGLTLFRLGVPTRLAGKIGNDPFGKIVRGLVERFDPELSRALIEDSAAPTSYTVIINPPGVDRIFLHCSGANDWFLASDIDLELVRQSTLFHFGYPPLMRSMHVANGHELTEVFRRAKSTGVTTSLDMAFPDPSSEAGKADWHLILQSVLPFVDIFFPSFEEILFMLHRDIYAAMLNDAPDGDVLALVTPDLLYDLSVEMIEMGARIVMIKLGNRGVYLCTSSEVRLQDIGRAAPADLAVWANRELWAPCYRVNVVGTTGSGDATIAGFISGLLHGFSPGDTVNAAVAVGACNVEAADALGGIRSWEDTISRMRAGWERQPLQLNSPGWALEPSSGVWIKKSFTD